MRGLAAVLAAWITVLGGPALSVERAVTVPGGNASLHGTLNPADGARGPAVLLIAGSGPTDRDGNSTVPGVKPGALRMLAEGLAANGIVSLRFDKRGVGESATAAPAESDLRFTTYVDDAVAWAGFLAAQPDVSCVVVAGHSEGALIAAMASARTPVCGVIEISGASRRAADVIATQLTAAVPEPLRGQALATLAKIKAGEAVSDPPLPALFRPSVQPYLMSWLGLDPAAELARFKGPVLIIQGDNDLQVSPEDARRLAAAAPGARLLVVPGMNHVLKAAPADRAGNLATYADPTLPLDRAVIPAMVALVHAARTR